MADLTPKQIVEELDKYIIGQDKAKKSVAVALRNRYRRNLLPDEMRDEVTPKNILMMGPTGVGKTEIARRLAKLVEAPFIKVEATKFTEVGYVGRDVESMVRDLVETSIRLVKNRKMEEKYVIAEKMAEDQIIESLVPSKKKKVPVLKSPLDIFTQPQTPPPPKEEKTEDKVDVELLREQVRQQLKEGILEDQIIEIEIDDTANPLNMLDLGNESASISIGNIFGDMMPKKKKKRKVSVKEARKIIREQEAQNMLDMDQVHSEALENAEQNGIIFIDEIDKIASSNLKSGADVSRDGVQRDILPIVEGSVIKTKYGPIKTDYMLFIGAGAFHTAKVTDLIPELQGRFSVRVELENLTMEVFKQILVAPENALIKQYKMLLETEGPEVTFEEDAIDEIARVAFVMNEQTENIGARRLHTIMEFLLEDISYNITEEESDKIIIDKEYVVERFLRKVVEKDVDKYIL